MRADVRRPSRFRSPRVAASARRSVLPRAWRGARRGAPPAARGSRRAGVDARARARRSRRDGIRPLLDRADPRDREPPGADVRPRSKCRRGSSPSSRSTPRRGAKAPFAASERGQALRARALDQRLQPGAHQRGLLRDSGQAAGVLEQFVVDVQRSPHVYRSFLMCIDHASMDASHQSFRWGGSCRETSRPQPARRSDPSQRSGRSAHRRGGPRSAARRRCRVTREGLDSPSTSPPSATADSPIDLPIQHDEPNWL